MVALVLTVGGCVALTQSSLVSAPVAARFGGLLATFTVALAGVAAVQMVLRWRLSGESRAAALGFAVFLLFAARPAAGDVARALTGGGVLPVGAQSTMVIAGLALLAAQTRRPAVDTGWGLGGPLVAVVVSVAGVGTALQHLGVWDRWWAGALGLTSTGQRQSIWAPLTLAALTLLVAFPFLLVRTEHRRSRVDPPVGLALLASSGATAAHALGGSISHAAVLSDWLMAVGALLLVGGTLRALVSEHADQRARLFSSELSESALRAWQRVADDAQRTHAHQARNVVLAVRSAVFARERRPASLTDDDRAVLADILRRGLQELGEIVTVVPVAKCGWATTSPTSEGH